MLFLWGVTSKTSSLDENVPQNEGFIFWEIYHHDKLRILPQESFPAEIRSLFTQTKTLSSLNINQTWNKTTQNSLSSFVTMDQLLTTPNVK